MKGGGGGNGGGGSVGLALRTANQYCITAHIHDRNEDIRCRILLDATFALALEQPFGYGEARETELVSNTEFLETEEIVAEGLGKIASTRLSGRPRYMNRRCERT